MTSVWEYEVWEGFWTMLWFFLFFIWIWLLISVFGDIFRSDDLSGWSKAFWTIFVVVLPYLGVFVYLIARGQKMGEHAMRDASRREEQMRSYVQEVAGSGTAPPKRSNGCRAAEPGRDHGGGVPAGEGEAAGLTRAKAKVPNRSPSAIRDRCACPRGDLNPHALIRALAPQASASANSATRTSAPRTVAKRRAASPHRGDARRGCQDGGMSTDSDRCRRDRRTTPRREVVEMCRDLIRIDTTNYGDRRRAGGAEGRRVRRRRCSTRSASSPGSTSPSRAATSLVARWGGTRRATALLLHGHLDVVPAAAEDWQVDPFSGEIQDGYLWGRGAVDMKDFDAMLLSRRAGPAARRRVPERPIVLCFTADEEAGGHQGAQVLVERPPRRVRGLHRGRRRGRRLQHHGPRAPDLPDRGRREGHGLDAAHRARPRRPRLDDQPRQRGHPAGRGGRPDRRPRVAGAADADHADAARGGRRSSPAPRRPPRTPRRWSRSSAPPPGCSGAVIRNTTNPTMLGAGYKVNVVPTEATAHVDGRFLPGYEDEFFATLAELCGEGIDDRLRVQPAALGDAVRRRPGRRDGPRRSSPRTRTRSWRRT